MLALSTYLVLPRTCHVLTACLLPAYCLLMVYLLYLLTMYRLTMYLLCTYYLLPRVPHRVRLLGLGQSSHTLVEPHASSAML
eukprot:scaffold110065_cov51-Phaeocystis_antarctica.AAC.4